MKNIIILMAATVLIIFSVVGCSSSNEDNSYSMTVDVNGKKYCFSEYIEDDTYKIGDLISIVQNIVPPNTMPKEDESNYFDAGTKLYRHIGEDTNNYIIVIDKDGSKILLKIPE